MSDVTEGQHARGTQDECNPRQMQRDYRALTWVGSPSPVYRGRSMATTSSVTSYKADVLRIQLSKFNPERRDVGRPCFTLFCLVTTSPIVHSRLLIRGERL